MFRGSLSVSAWVCWLALFGILSAIPSISLADEVDSLVIEVDLTLGGPDSDQDYFFGAVTAVVENSMGEIFVSDFRQSTVFKFSPSGELLSKYTKAGEGPEDIMSFATMAIDDHGQIYLAGQGGRVVVLDSDFGFVTTFDRPNPSEIADSIDLFPGGTIAIAAVNLGSHTTIDVLGPNYEHLRSFSDTYAAGSGKPLNEESTYAGGKLAVSGTDKILFVQDAPYLVRVFSIEGNLLYEASRGGQSFVLPPPEPEMRNGRVFVGFRGGATGVAPVGAGDILVGAWRRDEAGEKWGLLCLYGSDLELLARQEFEFIVTVTGRASGGRVFLQEKRDDGIRVVRAHVRRVKS